MAGIGFTLVAGTLGAWGGGAATTALTASLGTAGANLVGAGIQAAAVAIGGSLDAYSTAEHTIQHRESGRLANDRITTSIEGNPIPKGYGRFRVGGSVFWATRFNQVVSSSSDKVKSGKFSTRTINNQTLTYTASFALALCEGEIAGIGRIWIDGKTINLADPSLTPQIYRGTENQEPDDTMRKAENVGYGTPEEVQNVPAYRGLAYLVFKDFPISAYGNRIPSLEVEVFRTVQDETYANNLIEGVSLGPGNSEFGYDPDIIRRREIINGQASITRENRNTLHAASDWQIALETLEHSAPNCKVVSLKVPWYNMTTDNAPIIQPQVDSGSKDSLRFANEQETPTQWAIEGIPRAPIDWPQVFYDYLGNDGNYRESRRYVVKDSGSQGPDEGFGPTGPSGGDIETRYYEDTPERRAAWVASAQGKADFLYWRERQPLWTNAQLRDHSAFTISANATPSDASVIRAIQDLKARGYQVIFIPVMIGDQNLARGRPHISTWWGTYTPNDFSTANGVPFNNNTDSKLGEWSYSRFIYHYARLCQIAGGVGYFCLGIGNPSMMTNSSDMRSMTNTAYTVLRAINSTTKYGYISGWEHYQYPDLWQDADFIGIDYNIPISDWRDGIYHQDYLDGANSIYDIDYLKSNVLGGEEYEWYYASEDDREHQRRTDLTTRRGYKDVFGWRGQHSLSAKVILFASCPSVNKGSNYRSDRLRHSAGTRDDDIQVQFIRAITEFWREFWIQEGIHPDNSPIEHIVFGEWDTRPWPAYPLNEDVWPDASTYPTGIAMNGKIDTIYLPELLHEIAKDFGITGRVKTDFSRAYGACDGFTIPGPVSYRAAVSSLLSIFQCDIIESGDTLKAVSQQEVQSLATVGLDDIADVKEGEETVILVRKEAKTLPKMMTIRTVDPNNEYEPTSSVQTREVDTATASPVINSPIVIDSNRAQELVDEALYGLWAKREQATFGLLSDFLFLEPGDVITLKDFGVSVRINSITDGNVRKINAQGFDLSIFTHAAGSVRTLAKPESNVEFTFPDFQLMDLPILDAKDESYAAPYIAATALPWPEVSVFRSITNDNFHLDSTVSTPGAIGRTVEAFGPGPLYRWDNTTEIIVQMSNGQLASVDDIQIYDRQNTLAIGYNGLWELIQFANAELIGPNTYKLTRLLRGQKGTEDAMGQIPRGANVVFIDDAVQEMGFDTEDIDNLHYIRFGPATRDIGDESYLTTTYRPIARGLRPFSPVLRDVYREANGDITIRWHRRSRLGGDSWVPADVPLNEPFEQYAIILSQNGTVRENVLTNDARYTYSGTRLDGDIDVEVYQKGKFRDGVSMKETINV